MAAWGMLALGEPRGRVEGAAYAHMREHTRESPHSLMSLSPDLCMLLIDDHFDRRRVCVPTLLYGDYTTSTTPTLFHSFPSRQLLNLLICTVSGYVGLSRICRPCSAAAVNCELAAVHVALQRRNTVATKNTSPGANAHEDQRLSELLMPSAYRHSTCIAHDPRVNTAKSLSGEWCRRSTDSTRLRASARRPRPRR